ncbi:hypothetical protein AVEN_148080-1 [Araneus ventricosus]|uniref:DUF4817 domain-containing protein n=1 Tax=Araneus ventricosus TaxID=182803 RepID=A0A4Y2G8X1_ARAVE|nr:hypothetical protein AVEN_148080-1 [Araneus ventricosus]
MSKRPSGSTRTVHAPENVESVIHAVLRSPSRSVRKNSSEPGLSHRSLPHEGSGSNRGKCFQKFLEFRIKRERMGSKRPRACADGLTSGVVIMMIL